MFPESNAPVPTQAWVRDVSTRAAVVSGAATRTERNAYAFAGNNKSAYELIGSRIDNIDTFTTGLFEQAAYGHSMGAYSTLAALPVLYEYTSGDFQIKTAVTQRIPFSRYNELTVTADGAIESFTTDVTATSIDISRPLLPMVQATIPGLSIMYADGRYLENQLTYASRWTVENFEPFADYNIPGNVVPSAYQSTFGQSPPGHHPDNGTSQVRYSRDGYSGYSMYYTREWLMDFMQAIADYTTIVSPPPSGARYFPPDVNRVEIILGYYYQIYTSGTATNTLYINDNRLTFSASNAFSLEGIKNLGY